MTLPAQSRTESLDGVWEIRRGSGPAAGPWQAISVPGAFESVLGVEFDGIAEYRRTFAARPRGAPIYLRFAAVATHATVFVNDRKVGEHLGGWTPFRCRIDQALRDADPQQVRVVVDERVGHNTQGFLPAIAPHFGGIWQSVTLQRFDRPVLDRDAVEVRAGFRNGRCVLAVDPGPLPPGTRAVGAIADGAMSGAPFSELAGDLTTPRELALAGWSPDHPVRHVLRLRLVDAQGRELDAIDRPVAFGSARADGRRILWNDHPLRVRGMLHWGYEPPDLAPNRPRSYWLAQLRLLKACGFNLVKACLWVPPPEFFDAAEEAGVLVWQEYPAWHPDFSAKHLPALEREYEEFFRLDRARTGIVARSLTCETGRSASQDVVVKRLFERCKAVTGAALIEDDSSWITWNRYHDFYDDHPYGNCRPWLERLRGFDRHIREHGAKPLLLGEAITADTWLDLDALAVALGAARPWWTPFALAQQRAFAAGVRARFGANAAAALIPDSKRFAMLARKYQIETFHRVLPDAGYVCSVMRDFRKARMGLLDDLGRPKWKTAEFAWHGAHTPVLDDPRAIRAVAHRLLDSVPALHGEPRLACRVVVERWDPVAVGFRRESAHTFPCWPRAEGKPRVADALRRVTISASGTNPSEWAFYEFPAAPAEPPGTRVVRALDAATWEFVERGGRALLWAGAPGGPRSQRLWFLRGAPF
ncbi:MAG: hypothetical protein KDC87_12645, partial [Planctomycetes bacterium]|nr:hypothetical protein [Planctomycetota bacterium]